VSNGTPGFTWSQTGTLPDGLTFTPGVGGGPATISGIATGASFTSPFDAASWSATPNPNNPTGGPTSASVAPNCLATVTVTDAVGGTSSANFQIGSIPSSSCIALGYAIDLSNPPGSAKGGGGVPQSSWTFQAFPNTPGTVTFNWQYVGFHSFFEVTAFLNVFSGSNVTTLYNSGQPVDCCTSPSAGFNVSGTATIPVTANTPFGFTVGGSNGDLDSVLNGTVFISNFSFQPTNLNP
jgi:hypothetical protein